MESQTEPRRCGYTEVQAAFNGNKNNQYIGPRMAENKQRVDEFNEKNK